MFALHDQRALEWGTTTMKMTPERENAIRIIKEIRRDIREMRVTLERLRERLEPRER